MLHIDSPDKPLIGITCGANPNPFTMMCHQYAVYSAGGRSVRLSPGVNMERVHEINGIIVSGGNDINPALYGEENIASIDIDDERDAFEKKCIELAYEERLPILGICRGSQLMSVIRGGNLYQDIPTVFEGFVPTQSTFAKIFTRRKIEVEAGTRLSRVLAQPDSIRVNSLHHQAHRNIGKGLRVVAKDEQNIVQAIEGVSPDHFVLGVQWHPEYMLYAARQRRIFKALVAASLRSNSKMVTQQNYRVKTRKSIYANVMNRLDS